MRTKSRNRNSQGSGGALDIVNAINSIVPRGIEFHLNCKTPEGAVVPCHFLGPNTDLESRLSNYSNGKYDSVITPPVNELDRLAMDHDLAYSSKDLGIRHEADRVLLNGAQRLIDDPGTDSHTRRQAGIVSIVIGAKLKLGLGHPLGKWGLGAPDINVLVREAQIASQQPGFSSPGTGVLSGLLVLGATIGIPALLAVLAAKSAKKTREKESI